jgi:hypothetical protein
MKQQKPENKDRSKRDGERSQQVEKRADKKNNATESQRRTASGGAKP